MVDVIETECGGCGNFRSVPASAAGKKFRCKECNTIVPVEAPPPEEEEEDFGGELDFSSISSAGEALGGGNVVNCEECDEPYGEKSKKCPSCGAPNPEFVKRKQMARERKEEREEQKKGMSFFDMYRQPILIGGGALAVVLVVTVMGYALSRGVKGTQSVTGREQIEWYDRTTAKWIELEEQGKARRVEALWQDQRWMPLEQVLTLDWAALPDWFEALKNEKTQMLAENILKKWRYAKGAPYPEDLVAGIKDENEDVVYFSIVITEKLADQSDKDAMVADLERLRDGDNERLSAAATTTLEAIGK